MNEPNEQPDHTNTRISSNRNVLNILPRVEIRPMNGRVLGTKSPHIPPIVKAIIGEAAHMAGKGGGCTEVAEAFDVHRNTVTHMKENTGEAKKILDENIRSAALDRIVGMFETSVSPEKLSGLETKDATRAMKDLAKIAETFTPKSSQVFNGPTIILYNPVQHSEDDYDVIDIKAKEIR